MNRFSLLIVLYFCVSVFCFCQPSTGEKPKTNLEVFEENISKELEKYFYYPEIDRNFLFVFIVNPKARGGSSDSSESEAKFLTAVIKKTASDNKINFSFAQEPGSVNLDSNYYLIRLKVHNLQTRYTGFKKNKFLGEKTLIRKIQVKIGANIRSHDGKYNLIDSISTEGEDEINLDGYETLESSSYYFTHGEPPKIGTFERIIFPVLLIAVTAATTILFFVIRTK